MFTGVRIIKWLNGEGLTSNFAIKDNPCWKIKYEAVIVSFINEYTSKYDSDIGFLYRKF